MKHDFMRSFIRALGDGYAQPSELIKKLSSRYLGLLGLEGDAPAALDALLSLNLACPCL